MDHYVVAVILGVVEGLTEFIPVSSTGHLIVAASLLHFSDPSGTFEIVIQLGAVVAVIWFYRAGLTERTKGIRSSRTSRKFWLNLFTAFLPAAVLGLLTEHAITTHLFHPAVVSIALILGGIALWLIDNGHKNVSTREIHDVTLSQAALIGCVQVLALIPGVSRSGASIAGGLIVGLDRRVATEFSFYLAIPTLGAATLYKLGKSISAGALHGSGMQLMLGTFVAFLCSIATIRWFLSFVSHNSFRPIAIYRIIAGLVLLVLANR